MAEQERKELVEKYGEPPESVEVCRIRIGNREGTYSAEVSLSEEQMKIGVAAFVGSMLEKAMINLWGPYELK